MTKADILGIKVDNLTEAEVVQTVKQKLAEKEKFWIATPNPEMIVGAQKDGEFKKVLNAADLAIPDGMGLVWAAKILGREIKERLTGADLMARFCQVAAKEGWKVVFLGGRPGVAAKALAVLEARFSELEGLALEGPKELLITNYQLQISDQGRNREAIGKINIFRPDLLFVGFGMGKQERWVIANLPSLKIGGAMVVGGAFDFYAGRVRRAPVFIRQIGFEWFWRLILEPWRWRRQLSLFRFIWLILKERF